MVKKRGRTPWDKYSFNLAWILAVLLALGGSLGMAFAGYAWWSLILVVLGLIVGFMHSVKEITPLVLLAVAVAIFTGSSLAAIPYIGTFLVAAVAYFIAFLTPAALVVSIRRVFQIMR